MENVNNKMKTLLKEYTILICDVLLFSSAINSLFQMLSYTKTFDIALFIVSLLLGCLVYYFGIGPKKTPIINKRIVIAICSVIVWAVLIPVLYTAFPTP